MLRKILQFFFGSPTVKGSGTIHDEPDVTLAIPLTPLSSFDETVEDKVRHTVAFHTAIPDEFLTRGTRLGPQTREIVADLTFSLGRPIVAGPETTVGELIATLSDRSHTGSK